MANAITPMTTGLVAGFNLPPCAINVPILAIGLSGGACEDEAAADIVTSSLSRTGGAGPTVRKKQSMSRRLSAPHLVRHVRTQRHVSWTPELRTRSSGTT